MEPVRELHALARDGRWRPFSPRDAETIAAMTEPALRNLHITQGYHDLTLAMTALLGHKNLSWCGFATWASKTAGRFIRGDYMPEIVQTYLDRTQLFATGVGYIGQALAGRRRDPHLEQSLVVLPVERITREVARQVATGNLMVFAELAPLFARFVECFHGAGTADPGKLAAFLAPLRRGSVEQGGQELLISAFTHYHEAIFATDARVRAERIFLANCQVGWHEQVRLQGPILGSLSAPIADFIIDAAQERAHQSTPPRLHRVVDRAVARALAPLSGWLRREWCEVCTRWLMQLELPRATLHLGSDVPRLRSGRMFPRDLETPSFPELLAVLAQLDFTPHTTSGSAAHNWGELRDRMNFICDFFRSRQQDDSLYCQPFTDCQLDSLFAGQLPEGDL